MFLLDTNICIFMMRQSSPSVIARIEKMNTDSLFLSALTVHELHFGAEKRNWGEKHRQNLKLFLSPFTILPFDAEDAVAAAKIRAYLAQQGTPIGPYDLQIATQGLTRNLIVVTHNFGEFSRIPGLIVEDWA